MDLPPPGPNALELAFRRLLLKCEQQARGGVGGEAAANGVGAADVGVGVASAEGAAAAAAAARGRAGGAATAGAFGPSGSGVLRDWRVDPKFHCYVDVLREQLQALEGAPDAGGGLPGARTPPLPLPPPGGGGAGGRPNSNNGNPPPPPLPPPSQPPAQDRPPPDVLALYRARVRALSEALRPPDVPAFCVGRASALAGSAIVALRAQEAAAAAGRAAAAAAGAGAGAGGAGVGGAALATPDAGSASAMLQRPAGGPPRRQPPAGAAAAAAAKGAAASGGGKGAAPQPQQQVQIGKEAAARLATQQALQDGLAEELLGMTAELKAGALAMQGALRQRGKLVDEAEAGLDASAVGARAAARRAGEQYRRSRASFCQTCLVMVCVACVFAGMIVWIKLTSMVGLKGGRKRGWIW